jgi:hypothetical protein
VAGVQGEVLDSLDMFGVTARFPEQVAEAAKVAQGIEGLPPANEVDNVLVLGMGGSGTPATSSPPSAAAVPVVRGVQGHAAVVRGPGTLCFAAVPGNTEETSRRPAAAAGPALWS